MIGPLQLATILLTLTNTLLLVLSLILSYGIVRSSARDSVRTAIEQLSDIALRNNEKLTAILHSFNHTRIEGGPETRIIFKQYAERGAGSIPVKFLENIEKDEDEMSDARFREVMGNILTRHVASEFDEDLASILGETTLTRDGLVIQVNTRDPVKVKRVADAALLGLHNYTGVENISKSADDSADVDYP